MIVTFIVLASIASYFAVGLLTLFMLSRRWGPIDLHTVAAGVLTMLLWPVMWVGFIGVVQFWHVLQSIGPGIVKVSEMGAKSKGKINDPTFRNGWNEW